MTPLFIAFIDGLKPESIKHMPFLDSLETKRRIRTESFALDCVFSLVLGDSEDRIDGRRRKMVGPGG